MQRATEQPITRDDVIQSLGEVDDEIIAELVATGASAGELATALDRLRQARTGPWQPEAEPGRVATLCELLASWWSPDDEDEQAGAS